ncbi:MAG: periplasmic heavy metal sensor [Planktomarina sp.]
MARMSSKLLGWLLAVSLAVNVAVIGAVGSFIFAGPHGDMQQSDGRPLDRTDGGKGGPPVLGPIFKALPPKERRALMRQLRKINAGMRLSPDDLQARQEALHRALTAETFDAAAFAQALDTIRVQQDARAQKSFEVLTDYLSGLTLDQRQDLATALENEPPRRP